MAKFRTDSIADLARQLGFSPHETREAQLAAAEELLHLIDPARAYPLNFVVFKITGYHPKQLNEDLLTGLALQHDLGLLIEQVSETLDLDAARMDEPVLSIDDVTEKFNVASKTVQRWRRRGLPARRVVFADGKRRIGFLLSSVDRFLGAHREQLDVAVNCSVVGEAERQCILRRARLLATAGRCCLEEITRRVGRKLNRSPLTILHTVRRHDDENPSAAIFPLAAVELGADDRERAMKLFRRGTPIGELAARFGRPRSAVCRVLLGARVERLNRKKVRFIDDPLYHGQDAAIAIDSIVSQDALTTPVSREELRVPRDLPPYLRDLYRTPLLSPGRERALFLKFNFHKFQFVQARRKLDPQLAGNRDLRVLEEHLRLATETKNAIVQANLRLVVSVARKHLRPPLSLMELVSEGNITLMRAVEGFDVHRGHRFSTYCTLALMKGFARGVPAMLAGLDLGRKISRLPGIHSDLPGQSPRAADDSLSTRDEVRNLIACLDDRERSVLLAHYGVGETSAATHEEIGRRLNLSKQRVRQIEQSAMTKLRAVVGK